MSKPIHQKMHKQHSRWRKDLEAWQLDASVWKAELEKSMGDLQEISAMLEDSLDALNVHSDTVWEALQRLKAHEQVIGEESRLGENKTDKDWAAIHDELSSQQVRVGDSHERIKHHHHRLIAEITKALKDARKEM